MHWLPQANVDQQEIIERCRFVLENDGWEQGQPSECSRYSEDEKTRIQARNRESLDERLAQLESLLELPTGGTRRERFALVQRLMPAAI